MDDALSCVQCGQPDGLHLVAPVTRAPAGPKSYRIVGISLPHDQFDLLDSVVATLKAAAYPGASRSYVIGVAVELLRQETEHLAGFELVRWVAARMAHRPANAPIRKAAAAAGATEPPA